MARQKKQVKSFTNSFQTAGEVINNGDTIRMEDGSIFRRTVVPSRFSKAQDPNADESDFEVVEEQSIVSDDNLDDLP